MKEITHDKPALDKIFKNGEAAGAEAPSTKHQAPEKLQAPSTNGEKETNEDRRVPRKKAEKIKAIPKPEGKRESGKRESGKRGEDLLGGVDDSRSTMQRFHGSEGLAFRVEPKRLLAGLTKLKPLKGGKTLPALSCVKITATETLSLEVTNLDQYGQAWVLLEEEVESEGEVLVDLTNLMELVKLAEKEEIRLSERDGWLRVRSGDWTAELPCLDVEDNDFPIPEWAAAGELLEIPEGRLLRLLALALPAVSDDENRYVLNGVRLQAEDGGRLCAVATNGRCLAQATASIECADIDCIVPADAVRALMGVLNAGSKEVARLQRMDKGLEITAGGVRLLTKVIEGNYPNVRQVFPEQGWQIGIARERLVEMLKRGDIFSNGGDHPVEVAMDRTGVVIVSSAAPDTGRFTEEANICHAGAEPERVLTFRVNAKYIAMLGVPACEGIKLNTPPMLQDGQCGPLLWTGTETSAEVEIGYEMIIMPLGRLNGKKGPEGTDGTDA